MTPAVCHPTLYQLAFSYVGGVTEGLSLISSAKRTTGKMRRNAPDQKVSHATRGIAG